MNRVPVATTVHLCGYGDLGRSLLAVPAHVCDPGGLHRASEAAAGTSSTSGRTAATAGPAVPGD